MCIIIVKIKGSSFPSIKVLAASMERNPDGFSMAWNTADKKVDTFRSMDKKEFLLKYVELSTSLDPQTTGMVIHARIATHGSKKLDNCHCWSACGLAFAHNGILGNIKNRDDMTDSQTFFVDYFLPVLKASGWETAKNLARVVAGMSNKFAFICGSGNIHTEGIFEKHKEAGAKGCCYYSNSYGLAGLFDDGKLVGDMFAQYTKPISDARRRAQIRQEAARPALLEDEYSLNLFVDENGVKHREMKRVPADAK